MRRERSDDNNTLTNRGSRWEDKFSRHLQTDRANEGPGGRMGVENENDMTETQ